MDSSPGTVLLVSVEGVDVEWVAPVVVEDVVVKKMATTISWTKTEGRERHVRFYLFTCFCRQPRVEREGICSRTVAARGL